MNITQKLFSVVLLLVTIGYTHSPAQNRDPITADRPDQTESASVVPHGVLQGEFGISNETQSSTVSGLSVPGFLIKYGVYERFEFRIVAKVLSLSSGGSRTTGFTPVAVGMKVRLTEERGAIPKSSFLGHLAIPGAASPRFRATYAAPSFRFAFVNTVSDMVSIGYNVGADWDGATAEPIFAYTLVSGISVTPSLGIFAEVYGFAPQRSTANHLFDGGLTYLVTDDLMIDASAGVGLTSNAPEHFFSAGISYRMDL